MEDLHFEETGNLPMPTSMQQHMRKFPFFYVNVSFFPSEMKKLGKPMDVQKTPLRSGLGMIVNESKTPGARSLQNLASARKITSSAVKQTIPAIGFEIFEDGVDDEVVEKKMEPEQEEVRETLFHFNICFQTKNSPCSPIDTANRCHSFDSLAADIADDMLNMTDQDVVLFDEQPLGDYIDPQQIEANELASLGIEEWNEYPPIDPASRIADDFNYPLSLDEFHQEGDVKLEEATDYPELYNDVETDTMSREEFQKMVESLLNKYEDYNIDDLLAEEASIQI
ncbi:Protein CBR-IFY-1 [Caenorhabditis briggsae]|uniref:Protein CBR-IFY-1 n=1 Tax=Caenorhabditis briggsae TaxID=6238 RepID=A8WU94_CAEBR|nr:Protein CBR-IFY-1 [Caenorhabditis briggsae]CAP24056.2 Protein CBR-IFY-1 [Caenorhabditis briggsae]